MATALIHLMAYFGVLLVLVVAAVCDFCRLTETNLAHPNFWKYTEDAPNDKNVVAYDV
jgi:hypothetical protein